MEKNEYNVNKKVWFWAAVLVAPAAGCCVSFAEAEQTGAAPGGLHPHRTGTNAPGHLLQKVSTLPFPGVVAFNFILTLFSNGLMA